MTKMSVAVTALKSEIRRLAKSEAKALVAPLQKTIALLKVEVAALKKQAKVARTLKMPARVEAPVEEPVESVAFNAKRFKASRRRLKLSAADCGLMLETTGATVYNWENKGMRPRSVSTLQRIQAMQDIASPSEARAIVDEIKRARAGA